MKKVYLTKTQLILLAIGCALIIPYSYLPVVNTPPANQDSWITTILSLFYAIILSLPIFFLSSKFKGVAFDKFLESVFGKIFGKITSILYAIYLLGIYILTLLIAITFISIFILPNTSLIVIVLFLTIPTAYLAFKGLGTIGRIAIFIVPYVLLTIIFFLFMGLSIVDLEILRPILADTKLLTLNLGAFLTGAKISELVIFIVLSEFILEKVNTKRAITLFLTVFTGFFLLMVLPTLGVLGIDIAKHAWNPYYLYTRQVRAYDFIQRVESLNALGWLMGSLLRLAAYNFMASYALAGIFKKKNYKINVPIVSIIGIVVAFLPLLNKSNIIDYLRSNQVIAWVTLPFTVVIPIIIVLVYYLRKNKVNPMIKKIKEQK